VLFHGEGVGANAAAMPKLPGKLKEGVYNGIAVSSGQAQALGLRHGSSLTLQAATPYAVGQPHKAEVVDVFNTAGAATGARSVLMPLALAQALQGSTLVVFLSEPARIEDGRSALLEGLHRIGIEAKVRSWKEQSASYIEARKTSELAFDCIGGMVFAVIAAAIAATVSMNALERRREIGTLRAMGMRGSGVFLMLAAEAMWMAAIGIVLSMVASGMIAWLVNRAAVPAGQQRAEQGADARRARFQPDGNGDRGRACSGHAGRARARVQSRAPGHGRSNHIIVSNNCLKTGVRPRF
jgi:ABC-type lipoprotein release transport system permease subunit